MTDVRPGRPRRRWMPIPLVLAALALAAGGYLAVRDPGPAPVRDTTLKETGWLTRLTGGGPAWQDLPFAIDPAEEAAVGECHRIAGLAGGLATRDGVTEVAFDRDAVRVDLEKVLAAHPELFAAEHLLATWHRRRGDAAEAGRLFAAAESHAPAVLVQTYRHPDGRPLVGGAIRAVAVECNRVKGGSLDPSLKLRFTPLSGPLSTSAARLVLANARTRRAVVNLCGLCGREVKTHGRVDSTPDRRAAIPRRTPTGLHRVLQRSPSHRSPAT